MKTQTVRSGALAALSLLLVAGSAAARDDADTMHLTDEPGNWFRSENTGGPVTIIDAGDEVDFEINNCCTSTRHTVTLLVKPVGSNLQLDQDSSQRGSLSAEFDVPGVYVIVCKVHPYMTAVVAVRDAQGNIPEVSAESLPFIGHLGAASLPAETVLSVMTTVAPSDADKLAKWDILGPADEFRPGIPGVGEVWISTQFERVPGQFDENDVQKPGTITVLDAATFTVEREINGLDADGMWNNPHNMWADFTLDTVYNSNWFGQWINKIDRQSGQILDGIKVGEAPTHIITIPTPGSPRRGMLTIPLSADNDLVFVRDGADGLNIEDSDVTGSGKTHPHGHWLTCGRGDMAIVPNVFTGLGVGGSIGIMDTATGNLLREFAYDAGDPDRSKLTMPIAAGQCHVGCRSKAYVANAVSGYVTVIDMDTLEITGNIPVTLTPDGQSGLDLLHTLQVPIQTPVSPDEKWVATAVLSLTTVDGAGRPAADYVAIIDTTLDEVVALVPTPAGTHGVNWGAKLGGGFYAYVTNQHANVLSVIDPDPNGDGHGGDAAAVGQILLANSSGGAGVTDGTGGQGVKPLPMTHDGWIQPTVDLVGTGELSAEVEGWIGQLTEHQRNPHQHGTEGDFNQDGVVDTRDVTAFLNAWNAGGAGSDFNEDGVIDTRDVIAFLNAWTHRC
ncbi:MAG TPA: GC-type dockerin domain-anchored protein [Phycisphaerales bacterium]|nr:GC-type dockerin domain-anchored protein [Phycisphaerales bacterium]